MTNNDTHSQRSTTSYLNLGIVLNDCRITNPINWNELLIKHNSNAKDVFIDWLIQPAHFEFDFDFDTGAKGFSGYIFSVVLLNQLSARTIRCWLKRCTV